MAAKRDYKIIDDRIKPDLAGMLGGVRIEQRGGARVVRMSPAQAQFYLDHGSIAVMPQGDAKVPPKAAAPALARQPK